MQFNRGDRLIVNGVRYRVTQRYIRIRSIVRMILLAIAVVGTLYGLMYLVCSIAASVATALLH